MNVNNEEPLKDAKTLSKAERRLQEANQAKNDKINKEATRLHEMLCNEVVTLITESKDPESEETQTALKRISARWKVYCAHKQLAPSAFQLLDTFCKSIVDTYLKAKEPIKVTEPLPETMVE